MSIMNEKEKIRLEYVFDKISRNSLWDYLSTPTGLAGWFADDVSIRGNNYLFTWNRHTQEAEKTVASNHSFIRFRWLDEDPGAYFEFRIRTTEITGSTSLEITDFVEPEEKQEAISLWESQIKTLKRTLGI
jgi:uncharacterized protein YndB with AHSA1/START domain